MKKVLSLLKPFGFYLALSIIFATLNTVLQLMITYYTKNITEYGILAFDMEAVKRYGLILLGFTLACVILSILNTYFSTKTSVGYAISLRNYIFERVSRLSQSNIDKIGVSSLVTRTTNDVRQVHDFVLSSLKSLIPVPIMLAGSLYFAFVVSPELTKMSLTVIPMLLILAGVMLAIIIPMYSKIQKLVDKINQLMREKISGIRVIRAFNKTEYEDKRFDETNKTLTGLSLKASRIMAALMPFITVFMYGLIFYMLYTTVKGVDALDPALQAEEINGTIPRVTMFISLFTMIISSVTSIIAILISIPRAVISGRRIKDIMDAQPDITEPENPITPEAENRGKVEFKNVSFKYKPKPPKKKKKRGAKKTQETEKTDKKPFSLENISFSSKPGEITAIIGVTGSGKTSLINLIPRLYDASEGEILLAGVNVKDLPIKEIMNRIAFVPQQAFLFSGTIADNIRYGSENATDAEIWRALEIAQAKSFVASMPDGINSFVSQAGKNYSGGQKQRLAIARAVIKNAEIIIFDDSFSALDLATDARLRAALKETLNNTNIIIVAQRVGTVMNADRILVLDSGKLVGSGTHSELIKTCEQYREIVATQLSEEALKEGEE